MADQPDHPGPKTVTCAVCATPYEDDPAAKRIRRCPSCGSRLIRQEDGRLGAVTTAAPPPAPAKGPAGQSVSRTASDLLVGVGVLLLVICAYSGLALMLSLMSPLFMGTLLAASMTSLIICVATGGAGAWCLAAAMRKRLPQTPKTKSCRCCGYPLPWQHVGRCPECGRLQNPSDPKFAICPGCRRSLRGFYGDNCPECGGDVRMVVDGQPPDERTPG